jgi:hypothetical protein
LAASEISLKRQKIWSKIVQNACRKHVKKQSFQGHLLVKNSLVSGSAASPETWHPALETIHSGFQTIGSSVTLVTLVKAARLVDW